MRRISLALIVLLAGSAFAASGHLPVSALASSSILHPAVAAPPPSGKVSGAIHTTGGWSVGGRTVSLTQQQGGTPVEIATNSVDAANRFAFEHVPMGDDYLVRLLGIDDGPLGPCSSPDLFAVYPGETSRVLISCWR